MAGGKGKVEQKEKKQEEPCSWRSDVFTRDTQSNKRRRRNEDQGGSNPNLPRSTMATLPDLDRAGLEFLEQAMNGHDCAFTFRFFNVAFPVDVVDLVCVKVSEGLGQAVQSSYSMISDNLRKFDSGEARRICSKVLWVGAPEIDGDA